MTIARQSRRLPGILVEALRPGGLLGRLRVDDAEARLFERSAGLGVVAGFEKNMDAFDREPARFVARKLRCGGGGLFAQLSHVVDPLQGSGGHQRRRSVRAAMTGYLGAGGSRRGGLGGFLTRREGVGKGGDLRLQCLGPPA